MSIYRGVIALIATVMVTMGWVATQSYSAMRSSSVITVSGASVYVSDEIGACLSATGNTKACNATDLAAKNVDSQDDIWRAAVKTATSCTDADFAVGAVEAATDGGARVFNVSGVEVHAQMYDLDGSGGVLNATKRSSGAQTTGAGNTDMQDDAPKPASLQAAPYFNNNANGASTTANAILFTFNKPLRTFGAWFGDVETKLPLTNGRQWDASSSTASDSGEGGARASLRLIFDTDADGAISAGDTTQDISIPETLAPTGDLWAGATSGSAAARLAAPAHTGGGGDPRFCGGGGNATDAVGCGNSTTRWIGFVADSSNVIGMLLTVGDDDHLLAGPQTNSSADQVASCVDAGGASDGDCDGGTERLSMIGATTIVGSCAAPTATNTTAPTATNTAVPTVTFTNTVVPTATLTNTVVAATNTAAPAATNTPEPLPTSITVPVATSTIVPTATSESVSSLPATPTEVVAFAVVATPTQTALHQQLAVTLKAADSLVIIGQETQLFVEVTNLSSAALDQVVGLLPLPNGFTYLSGIASQGDLNYVPAPSGVAYQLGTLLPGQTVTLTITVQVSDSASFENETLFQAHAATPYLASVYSEWQGVVVLAPVIPATGLSNPVRPSDWVSWIAVGLLFCTLLWVRYKVRYTQSKCMFR